jgi:PAS domain S-box-containing protein
MSLPAFGQADLSNCEREQIHLAGSIQPYGALLVVRGTDEVIVQASANAAAFLGFADAGPGDAPSGDPILGRPVAVLGAELAAGVRRARLETPQATHTACRCRIGAVAFDALLHRLPEGRTIVELERADASLPLSAQVDASLQTILGAFSLRSLCDDVTRIFRELTGYDRVMVYRFDDDGHGEIFSEQRRPDLEAYLGNRYPASDIPQIARRLYERSRVRVLVDAEYTPVKLVPELCPVTNQPLDMSLSVLRSMSPIHVQYMKNMGVSATLVVSLVVGGRLWGLIACHHYSRRLPHFEIRSACALLAEAVATRIAALEGVAQAQAELAVRRLEQRMIEAISREGDWRIALFDNTQSLLQPLGATGAALLFEGQVLATGDVPGTQELRALGRWLDAHEPAPMFATASLGRDTPEFLRLTPVASGLAAVPVSTARGEYLMWFRPEQVRTVTWGGDPRKPVLAGDDPMTLSPRRSFAQWHEVVEGTAEAWSQAELTAARLIGETVTDVVLQFRAVRLLIAQDQLDHVRRQVRLSEQPVVIADTGGIILLTNERFDRLLPAGTAPVQRIADLAAFFTESTEITARLNDVLTERRIWRGEVRLKTESGDPVPLLVRADPVFSAPDRVLGFVFLFTDLTERKAAEAARRRFQESIVDQHQVRPVHLDSQARLVYQTLLSSVVENAQLAALEITDGVDMARMPDLLESVRDSVVRTAEMLEVLICHARTPEAGPDEGA